MIIKDPTLILVLCFLLTDCYIVYIHLSAPTRHFQFKHFPNSKITSENRFLKKYYIITILIILKRFGQYFQKSTNGFPIVFSNLARKGSGFFFQARKLIFLPNGLYLPTKQPWGYPKF